MSTSKSEFFQKIVIDGKTVEGKALPPNINFTDSSKAPITGTLNQSIFIEQQSIGKKYIGTVDEILAAMKAEREAAGSEHPLGNR